ncbi:hypothetical protein D9M71_560030 [compost metagenome]
MGVEIQPVSAAQGQVVVEVEVVLQPVVFRPGVKQFQPQGIAKAIAGADEVQAADLGVGVAGAQAVVTVAGGKFVVGGEVSGFDVYWAQRLTAQVHAGGHFREQAAVGGGEDGCGGAHFTPLQLGVPGSQLECGTRLAVVVFDLGIGLAVMADRQQGGTGAAGAAVELDAQVGVGIHTQAERALTEARGVAQHQAMGPFFAVAVAFAGRQRRVHALGVAGAVAQVAVEVVVAIDQLKAAVFYKTPGAGQQQRRVAGQQGSAE